MTTSTSQGDRPNNEDFATVLSKGDHRFIGIFDGHGGDHAASFARERLPDFVAKHLRICKNDEEVLQAIKKGFLETHHAMWKELDKWPKIISGHPSTAGTTASIALIRDGKIYIGHCGDSGIVLGYTDNNDKTWKAMPLTDEHKPENEEEMRRIHQCGGKVAAFKGVSRVVWERPRLSTKSD